MNSNFTKEQAIAFGKSDIWKDWTPEQIVRLQLFEEKLCIPFDKFHEAVEKALNRSVWTHEFASSNIDKLQSEFLGEKPAPTFEEIISLIPEDKRIILAL